MKTLRLRGTGSLTGLVLCRCLALLVLGSGLGTTQSGLAASAHDTAQAQITDPDWIVVNPAQPSTLLAGTTGAEFGRYGTMFRSTDAGATWKPVATNVLAFVGERTLDIEQTVISTDGRHLLSILYDQAPTPGGSYSILAYSADGGVHWGNTSLTGEDDGYTSGPTAVATSPAAPSQAYALSYMYIGGAVSDQVVGSRDGGQTWEGAGSDPGVVVVPGADAPSQNDILVADPRRPRTVYVNFTDTNTNGPSVVRSDDAGATWTTIITPTASPALQTFAVSTNPLLPGTLIGQSGDPRVAADTRYFSTDSGHTWTVGTCPGDLKRTCPSFSVASVFGVGRSYAFVKDGIYPFTGTGPAGARLSISERLPVPVPLIANVQSGRQTGDPIYLLTTAHQLYQSSDAGQSWRLLTIILGPTPNLLPPSAGVGALPVALTHHSVAAPFLVTYRRLGLPVIGYPVTEAYLENRVLYQDFQRLRLRLGSHGRVIVAPLGQELFAYCVRQPDPIGTAYRQAMRAAPVAANLLRFWQDHGGKGVFGAPISASFQATNGDGSGRRYLLQYFANARLEWHPESRDPQYRVQVGLLGTESLIERSWLPHGTSLLSGCRV